METNPSLDKAVSALGGVVSCAEKLGLKNYQTLQQWRKAGVPAERCIDIERATNGQVTCEELRPDLAEQWAYLRGTAATPQVESPEPFSEVALDATEILDADASIDESCVVVLDSRLPGDRRRPDRRVDGDRRCGCGADGRRCGRDGEEAA